MFQTLPLLLKIKVTIKILTTDRITALFTVLSDRGQGGSMREGLNNFHLWGILISQTNMSKNKYKEKSANSAEY